MKFPVRVTDGPGGDGSVRMLNNEQEMLEYQQELYMRDHSTLNLRGEPVPNWSMPLSLDDVKAMQQQQMFPRPRGHR